MICFSCRRGYFKRQKMERRRMRKPSALSRWQRRRWRRRREPKKPRPQPSTSAVLSLSCLFVLNPPPGSGFKKSLSLSFLHVFFTYFLSERRKGRDGKEGRWGGEKTSLEEEEFFPFSYFSLSRPRRERALSLSLPPPLSRARSLVFSFLSLSSLFDPNSPILSPS